VFSVMLCGSRDALGTGRFDLTFKHNGGHGTRLGVATQRVTKRMLSQLGLTWISDGINYMYAGFTATVAQLHQVSLNNYFRIAFVIPSTSRPPHCNWNAAVGNPCQPRPPDGGGGTSNVMAPHASKAGWGIPYTSRT